ncbi:MAG TPA: hypothetical protein VHA30_03365, partial [Patescibacteria group bacterium]|nr:hypothetical protein [Patescibacteria group bacterium]
IRKETENAVAATTKEQRPAPKTKHIEPKEGQFTYPNSNAELLAAPAGSLTEAENVPSGNDKTTAPKTKSTAKTVPGVKMNKINSQTTPVINEAALPMNWQFNEGSAGQKPVLADASPRQSERKMLTERRLRDVAVKETIPTPAQTGPLISANAENKAITISRPDLTKLSLKEPDMDLREQDTAPDISAPPVLQRLNLAAAAAPAVKIHKSGPQSVQREIRDGESASNFSAAETDYGQNQGPAAIISALRRITEPSVQTAAPQKTGEIRPSREAAGVPLAAQAEIRQVSQTISALTRLLPRRPENEITASRPVLRPGLTASFNPAERKTFPAAPAGITRRKGPAPQPAIKIAAPRRAGFPGLEEDLDLPTTGPAASSLVQLAV